MIQPQWPARALVKAELEERGYEVLGADSIRLGVDLSMKRGFRPDLLVVDTNDLPIADADSEALAFLRGKAPLLLIGSTQYGSQPPAKLLPSRVLFRPLTVGEIADAVSRLLA